MFGERRISSVLLRGWAERFCGRHANEKISRRKKGHQQWLPLPPRHWRQSGRTRAKKGFSRPQVGLAAKVDQGSLWGFCDQRRPVGGTRVGLTVYSSWALPKSLRKQRGDEGSAPAWEDWHSSVE